MNHRGQSDPKFEQLETTLRLGVCPSYANPRDLTLRACAVYDQPRSPVASILFILFWVILVALCFGVQRSPDHTIVGILAEFQKYNYVQTNILGKCFRWIYS